LNYSKTTLALVHIDTLPYQEVRPLPTITEEGTALVDHRSDKHTSHRHIYMAKVEGEGNENPNELLEQISGDEVTANAGDENDAECDARRLRNQKCASCKRNVVDC
jgi:hypothetical protein